GQKELDKLVAKAKAAGARGRGLLLEGTAADAIVRTARSARADVIVMGTHGRTGLARLFMGSVAERVIGPAPCPVLTVRGKYRGRGAGPPYRARRARDVSRAPLSRRRRGTRGPPPQGRRFRRDGSQGLRVRRAARDRLPRRRAPAGLRSVADEAG